MTVVKGGSTYEKRDIVGVRVNFGKNQNAESVLIDGGIHAREWYGISNKKWYHSDCNVSRISPATVTFILNALLTSTDPEIRNLAERYNWYIFPVINPDGYEYTFDGVSHNDNKNKDYQSDCRATPQNNRPPKRSGWVFLDHRLHKLQIWKLVV